MIKLRKKATEEIKANAAEEKASEEHKKAAKNESDAKDLNEVKKEAEKKAEVAAKKGNDTEVTKELNKAKIAKIGKE